MSTTQIEQMTISDTKEIFERIKKELLKAQQEILVAVAWFTDDELFQVLLDKVKNKVAVNVIIADQPDNDKLDFDLINRLGGDMVKIKNVGYGIMNQKFCVVDRKVSVSGSYNWSVNAKNNNHETVIVTNHQDTVEGLVETFFRIRNNARLLQNGLSYEQIKEMNTSVSELVPQLSVTSPVSLPGSGKQRSLLEDKSVGYMESSLNNFKVVLDSIIATEVGSFDKELLKAGAYMRAKENNGDHQVLPQAMDSLYSNFINEIEVIAEKKTRLQSKIEEQIKSSVLSVELKTETEINAIKEKADYEKQSNFEDLQGLKGRIAELRLKVEANNETRIAALKEKITGLQSKMTELGEIFVKPPVNWPFSITLTVMMLLLAAYIFVFYSSVAYILIFSKEDIQILLETNSGSIATPEVFNAKALSKIFDKGIGGIFFQFFFVSIPLALGMYKTLSQPTRQEDWSKLSGGNQSDWWTRMTQKFGGIVLVLMVDCIVAYKVSKNTSDIEFLIGASKVKKTFWEIVFSNDFILVFILGALGIWLFSVVFTKLYDALNLRSGTLHQAKARYEKFRLEKEMAGMNEEILAIRSENDTLEMETAKLENQKESVERKLSELPVLQTGKIAGIQQQLHTYKERITSLASIYRSQVENDRLPVSRAEMENRINIFMEGWSKYLHDRYAVQLAETKTTNAIRECELWLEGLSGSATKHQENNLFTFSN